MNNNVLLTYDTQVTTKLSRFAADSDFFLRGELLNAIDVREALHDDSFECSCLQSNALGDYLIRLGDISHKKSNVSLSSKIYLLNKKLAYKHSRILTAIRNDFPSFILLDFTEVPTQKIDSILYDYKLEINTKFKERYLENKLENNLDNLNNLITQRHRQLEDNIQNAIYSDYLLLVPIHKTRRQYRSNMYSNCIGLGSYMNILTTLPNKGFVSYLGLRIPLLIQKEATLVYACLDNNVYINLLHSFNNIPSILMLILYLLNIKETELKEIKSHLYEINRNKVASLDVRLAEFIDTLANL